jgi:hypothetical protein
MTAEDPDNRPEVIQLFAAIKAKLPELQELLRAASDDWGYEDPIYRFYHLSFKVYRLQETTQAIVAALTSLLPQRPLNRQFMEIVQQGTGKTFVPEHNKRWLEVTRPILEAFFHARYFLEMVCKYGNELESPPTLLPSGWASVLYLYELR